ncbi:MAG: glycerophosphodiester phosphodiesterase [Cryptosporangiaceae bacterium]|nr:glycerophosphodiester phosphodiesterase [Cryptosporangiaceae bacterium]
MTTEWPLVVAHRGSSDLEAEHTIVAYERAVTEGADALECDVRMTRDGHLICVHDRRIDRTSNGRGVVSTFDLAALEEVDFGSWHPRLPDSADELIRQQLLDDRRSRAKVLRFDSLLELIEAADRPVRLLVETKHPTRYGALVEQTLVDRLRWFGFAAPSRREEARVTMMSFSSLAVRRVRELAPAVPTVQLLERVPVVRRDGSLPRGATVAGPGVHILRAHPGYVRRVQDRGYPVYVWTVDEPEDIDLVLSLGVDAVITNRPALVLRTLGR